MIRSELAVKQELTKVHKLRIKKNNSHWNEGNFAELRGMEQALAWVLKANAMSPSKVAKPSPK
jgi:hypothetical protein